MSEQQVVQKVKKLLALAERGGTPEEAANAAAKAQAILERYNLDRAALDQEPAPEPIGFGEPLEASGRIITWRLELASAVARANGCRILTTCRAERLPSGFFRRVRSIDIVGRPADVAAARCFYAYLVSEVDRLFREAPRPPGRWGRVAWANGFRRGVVDTLERRLEEARAQEASRARARYADDGAALVRISEHERKGDQVDDWIRDNLNVGTRPPSQGSDPAAFLAGRAAGEQIELGARRLLPGSP